MAVAMTAPMEAYTFYVPREDVRVMKNIAKRFGWELARPQKLNAATLKAAVSMGQGEYTEYQTFDDYLKALG